MKIHWLRVMSMALGILLLAGSLTACGQQRAAVPTSETKTQESTYTPGAADDFSQVYFPPHGGAGNRSATTKFIGDTAAEIFAAADSAIIGDVVQTSESAADDKSYSRVLIRQVLKGNHQEGDVVNISETGLRDGELNDSSFDGVPLLRRQMRVVLFLMPQGTMKNGESGYGIRGLYLGKFFFNNDGKVVYSGTLGSSDAMTMKDMDVPLDVDAFLSLLPLGTTATAE